MTYAELWMTANSSAYMVVDHLRMCSVFDADAIELMMEYAKTCALRELMAAPMRSAP